MYDVSNIRHRIEEYYSRISPICRLADETGASAIFELNTSNNSEVAVAVLEGTALYPCRRGSGWPAFVLGCLRELLKRIVLYILARVLGRNRHRDHEHLRTANTVLVGFVAPRGDILVAKDFEGFREAYLFDKRVVTLAQHLPFTPWRRYFGEKNVVPVEAHIRFLDVFRSLRILARLYAAIRRDVRLKGTLVECVFLEDFCNGHAIGSMLYARTVARLLEDTASDAVVCLPMERHEWEQVLLLELIEKRTVIAVQACSFSPDDLNMYVAGPPAPRYRRLVPHRLFVISEQWAEVFRKLGFDCVIEVARRHRFSNTSFHLRLQAGTGRILYLGSINEAKVSRDLEALQMLKNQWKIHIRLHPSLANVPQARFFLKAKDLSEAYDWCFFSDTSMVFQLKCDTRRLVWIDHEHFPNQDPTRWFPDWPGRVLKAPLGPEALAAGL